MSVAHPKSPTPPPCRAQRSPRSTRVRATLPQPASTSAGHTCSLHRTFVSIRGCAHAVGGAVAREAILVEAAHVPVGDRRGAGLADPRVTAPRRATLGAGRAGRPLLDAARPRRELAQHSSAAIGRATRVVLGARL